MSEEIKKNAVELSDDEMNEIAGGSAVVIIDRGRQRFVYSCSRGMRKAEDFYNIINGHGTCQKSDSCESCEYCNHSVTTYGSTKPDAYDTFNKSANHQMGYDFYYIAEY